MATFELDPKALAKALARDLTYTVTLLPSDVDTFKKRLSQAKVRLAIEGRLQYEATERESIVEGKPAKVITLVIVLIPKAAKKVTVLAVGQSKDIFDL